MPDTPTETRGVGPGPATRPLAKHLGVAVVLAVALAARLLHLWERHGQDPFFQAPVVDALTYLQQARQIAGGAWLGDQVFWQPPLFPYLLAGVLWLSGDGVFVAIRLVHAVLGTASCLLLYRLARRILAPRAALGAAVVMALYGPLLHFENALLSVALEVFLDLLLVELCTVALLRRGVVDVRLRLALAGFVAGLAALARPNILLFAVAFVLFWLWRERQTWRRSLAVLPAFVLPAALIIGAVTVRNWAVGGDVVPISANGGVNYYIGNNAAYDRTVAIHPGVRWEQLVGEPVRAGATTPSQRSDYFFAKAAAWALAHPLDFAALQLRKTWLFCSGPEWKRNLDVYAARQHSRLLALLMWDRGLSFPYGLLAPLALAGLALTWPRRTPALAVLRLFAISYAVSVILFFIAARYRMPAIPALLVFAAAAVHELLAAAAARHWRRLAIAGGTTLALAVLLNLPAAPRWQTDAQYWADLGEAQLRRGRPQAAVDALARALRLEPDYPNAEHNAAVALLDLGNPEAALRHARAALAGQRQRPDTQVILGRSELALGDTAAALRHLQEAVAAAPQLAAGHFELGRLLRRRGDARGAVEHLRIAVDLEPQDYWGVFELGRAWAALGRAADAREAFEEAMALAPERDEAPVAAAAMSLMLGALPAARRTLHAVLARTPDQPDALLNLGLLELRSGNGAAALLPLQRLRSQRPADPRLAALLRQAQALAGGARVRPRP